MSEGKIIISRLKKTVEALEKLGDWQMHVDHVQNAINQYDRLHNLTESLMDNFNKPKLTLERDKDHHLTLCVNSVPLPEQVTVSVLSEVGELTQVTVVLYSDPRLENSIKIVGD